MPVVKNAENSPFITFHYNLGDLVDFYIHKSTGNSTGQRYSVHIYSCLPSNFLFLCEIQGKKTFPSFMVLFRFHLTLIVPTKLYNVL